MRRSVATALALPLAALATEATVRGALLAWGDPEAVPCLHDTPETCRVAWMIRHRRAWPGAAPPLTVRFDPELGWLPPPTGFGDGEHVGSDGRRVVPAGPRTARATRLVLLGDSYTYGYDVADDATWAAVLARVRPDVDPIDLGVPGYGHDQMLLRWRRAAPEVHADAVLLGFAALDVARNASGWYTAPKPWFTLDEGELVLHGVPVDDPAATAWRAALLPWTAIAAGSLVDRLRERELDVGALTRLTDALLDRLRVDVEASGACFAVVYLPDRADGEALLRPYRAAYEAWVARTGTRSIDTVPAFEAAHAAGVVTDGATSHWSVDGNRVVGERLAQEDWHCQARPGLAPVWAPPDPATDRGSPATPP